MNNMTVRILVGLAGIPAIIGLVLLGGRVFGVATFVLAVGGLLEFYALARAKGARPEAAAGIAAAAAMYAPVLLPAAAEYLPVILGLITLFVVGARMRRPGGSAIADVSATIAGAAYFPFLFLFLPMLYNLGGANIGGVEGGRLLVLSLFVSVWMCDIAAYFAGKFLGRRKLFERVSPKKTWEGAAAGFVGAAAGFTLTGMATTPDVPAGHLLALGGLTGIFGQIGDLAESLLKRDAGVKDSSGVLPGHGGVLDRFDSMTFAAPVAYCYTVFVLLRP